MSLLLRLACLGRRGQQKNVVEMAQWDAKMIVISQDKADGDTTSKDSD
jgi:hypothetical protein